MYTIAAYVVNKINVPFLTNITRISLEFRFIIGRDGNDIETKPTDLLRSAILFSNIIYANKLSGLTQSIRIPT